MDFPIISLIVPMWNSEPYLTSFLDSLSRQRDALRSCEVIFVDDGSPDDSAKITEEWLNKTGIRGFVIRKANAGQASARNEGLKKANGNWVTFPDPDDMLSAGYLAQIQNELGKAEEAPDMIACKIVFYRERDGVIVDNHALRFTTDVASKTVNLNDHPNKIKLSAASSVFKMETIRKTGLTFDETIRPNFEDAAFVVRYLLHNSSPVVTFLPAEYVYRKRETANSTIDVSWQSKDKYLVVPERGWLETLRTAKELNGHVPLWVQNIVLYELSWYFSQDNKVTSLSRTHYGEVAQAFLNIVKECLRFIDAKSVMEYSITRLSYLDRITLLTMKLRSDEFSSDELNEYESATLPGVSLYISSIDTKQNLVQLKYYFAGEPPFERFVVNKRAIEPAYSKYRIVNSFGEPLVTERIVWLAANTPITCHIGSVTREFDSLSQSGPCTSGFTFIGKPDELALPTRSTWGLLFKQIRNLLTGRSPRIKRLGARLLFAVASSPIVRRKYRSAWTFIDRDSGAQDNAEHLFRWVKHNKPEVNAWFVIRRGIPDWHRLRSEGFRLIPFGTVRHKLLLLNTRKMISSQADHYLIQPLNPRFFGQRDWDFIFLQHGITHNDISRWLNRKPLAQIITATEAEYRFIVDDNSPFKFTSKEVKLAGFPRHDTLMRKHASISGSHRNVICIMPTWRRTLMAENADVGSVRKAIDSFPESDFMRTWTKFMTDPDLKRWTVQNGLEIAFIPHPNFDPHVSPRNLPENVTLVRLEDGDVQTYIARSVVAITDYSSISMDAAFLGIPVIYYQFDREEFFDNHTLSRGFFDYKADGFGPVVESHADAIAATLRLSASNSSEHEAYRARMTEFFTFSDDRNSERVFRAISVPEDRRFNISESSSPE